MKLKRKLFSTRQPKRPKSISKDELKSGLSKGIALTSAASIPFAISAAGDIAGSRAYRKLMDQASDRINHIGDLAVKGDPKAREFILRIGKNPDDFISKLKTVAKQHPDYVKKVGKAKLAVGSGLGAVAVGSSIYSHKKARQAEIAEKKYRKELREWKEKKKNEDKA